MEDSQEEDLDIEDPRTDWLQIAQEAYSASTDFMDANYRKQWERSYSNAASKHPAGSKYHTDAFKSRSRLFRPKTREMLNKNKAAITNALFSTMDVVDISAVNQNNKRQEAAANLWGHVLNYRLTNTIPWFKLVVGGFETAQIIGCLVSKQTWRKETIMATKTIVEQGPVTGQSIEFDVEEEEVVADTPEVTLIEPENFRFDPAARWDDVIGSSPYLIHVIPMYAEDILAKMEAGEWLPVALGQSSNIENSQGVRSSRQGGNKTDPYQANIGIDKFWVHMVHEVIVRSSQGDQVFYTLGNTALLSEPVPLKDIYPTGRPYVMGYSDISAFVPIPQSQCEQVQDLQAAANDIQNQRFDNVKLAMNGRYFVRRGSAVDMVSLRRSITGGVVQVNDVMADVRAERMPDVTQSSYAEQDRLNMDIDALAGQFSQSTVGANRNLNETVGGMNMMNGAASQATEFIVRTFVMTWVQPVLRQVLALEKEFESDREVLDVSAGKAGIAIPGQPAEVPDKQSSPADQGQEEVIELDDDLIREEVELNVNVGFGSTNPQQRISRLTFALSSLAQSVPQVMARIDEEEVTKEVFGAVGYQDGLRFLKKTPAAAPQQPPDPALAVKQMEVEQRQREVEAENVRWDKKLKMDYELGVQKIAFGQNGFEKDQTIQEGKLRLEAMRESTRAFEAAMKQKKIDTDNKELDFKATTGEPGI